MTVGGTVTVVVAGEVFYASALEPFVFGREQLDPSDMGISARAGLVHHQAGAWWLSNLSAKRYLLVETAATARTRVDPGASTALTEPQTTVLVPGAIYTHRIDVALPDDWRPALAGLGELATAGTGTITPGDIELSERDRLVVTTMFSGYLRPFPRHDPRPLTYQQVADVLGPPWTRVRVRKQVERLKERLARAGVVIDGTRANDDLAGHLIDSGLLTTDDLDRVVAPGAR